MPAPAPQQYPVYRSPAGQEQIAATPARETELRFAGWVKVRQPRRKSGSHAETPTPKTPSA